MGWRLGFGPGLEPAGLLTGARRTLYYRMVMQAGGPRLISPERLDATFAALADPTRRAILARLATGEASVMELAEPFAMTQPAISKHLKVLERAGLVARGQVAQRRPRRLVARPMAEAAQWLEKYRSYWETNFQQLDLLLDEMKAAGKVAKRPRPRGGTE